MMRLHQLLCHEDPTDTLALVGAATARTTRPDLLWPYHLAGTTGHQSGSDRRQHQTGPTRINNSYPWLYHMYVYTCTLIQPPSLQIWHAHARLHLLVPSPIILYTTSTYCACIKSARSFLFYFCREVLNQIKQASLTPTRICSTCFAKVHGAYLIQSLPTYENQLSPPTEN